MSPVTHLLLSWSFSSFFPFDGRDRVLVTNAGVVPDVDGAGMLWDLAGSKRNLNQEGREIGAADSASRSGNVCAAGCCRSCPGPSGAAGAGSRS